VADAHLWHPWLRINRVMRVMLQTRWSAKAWLVVRVEFRLALALRSESGALGGSTSLWLGEQRKSPRSNSTYPANPPATTARVLPMQLRIGDRLVDGGGYEGSTAPRAVPRETAPSRMTSVAGPPCEPVR
jgi:hypothetical protein